MMPHHFAKALIPNIHPTKAEVKAHALPFLVVVIFIMTFYMMSVHIEPGWLTYLISTICLVLIALTALARVNDIPFGNTSARWQVRRLGFIMVLAACVGITIAPWIEDSGCTWPAWRAVMMHMGVLAVWMTTPNMPPWFRYISGEATEVLKVEVPNNTRVEIVRNKESGS